MMKWYWWKAINELNDKQLPIERDIETLLEGRGELQEPDIEFSTGTILPESDEELQHPVRLWIENQEMGRRFNVGREVNDLKEKTDLREK